MPMDFKSKGISWVGNIYQKLETFYHEMDNIVPQDAVRYVEGQMHNVGENTKKLYSDVVQDLVPPRSYETQVVAQESNAADGLKDHRKVLNQTLVDALVPSPLKNDKCEELQNSNPTNLVPQEINCDSCADKIDCSVIGDDETAPASLDSEAIQSDEANCTSEVIDRDETAATSSGHDEDSFPIDNICSSLVSAGDSDYSVVQDDHDARGYVVPVHFKSLFSEQFQDENVDLRTTASDNLLVSELIGMESIALSDKVKDGESCVIVDSSLLYDMSFRHCGNKSYKKLLQDVFSSKRRLDKEYKLLAIMHEDLDEMSRRESEQNQLSSRITKASDGEWEIL